MKSTTENNRSIPLISVSICGALFLLSLIPIAIVAPYVRSTGDDLNYSSAVHHALMNGEGIIGVIRTVIDVARGTWYSWQGTWSSVALFSLQPGIWGNEWYPLTIVIALLCIVVGTWYFLHGIMRLLGIRRAGRWSIAFLVSILLIQYMPNVKCGIFWWTSVAHYTIAYGVTMLCMGWSIRWLEAGGIGYYIGMLISMSYLGGAGYPEVVLAATWFFLVILSAMIGILRRHNADQVGSGPAAASNDDRTIGQSLQPNTTASRLLRVRTYLLLVPFALEMAGFAISAAAPGNKSRGGEDFGFSIQKVIVTLIGCVADGIVGTLQDMVRVRLYVPILVLVVVLVYVYYNHEYAAIPVRYPALCTLAWVFIICIIRAPERYAGTEVSGGVPDSYWMVTLVALSVILSEWTIWFRNVAMNRMRESGILKWLQRESSALIILLVFLATCLVGYRHLISGSADYTCVEFIRGGALADYHAQMEEWLDLLEDPTLDSVVLPMMNDQQGPLMLMVPLETDGNWSNMVYEQYYDKTSIICIPREQYSRELNYH